MDKTLDDYGELPEPITEKNVPYYSSHTGTCSCSQVRKAKTIIEHDLIRYVGENTFVSLPINKEVSTIVWVRGKELELWKIPASRNYNKKNTGYLIRKNEIGAFSCQCQGWRMKNKKKQIQKDEAGCSHVLALYWELKRGKFGKKVSA